MLPTLVRASSKTRSDLVAAKIYPVTETGAERGSASETVYCLFNPYEYSVSKSNTYAEKGKARAGTKLELQNSGPQTLKLSLIFDTYEETDEAKKDVSKITEKLWNLMRPLGEDNQRKPGAPFVVFEWGYFKFVAVITNMTQKFTLFSKDGMPLRAHADITFTQHKDEDDYDRTNPTSGGGPAQRLYTVVSGERLDNIAADVYEDAGKWRLIADYNGITNPLALRPGQQLLIPEAT